MKLQAGALVLYNSDNIVIASVLGAAAVTPYAVAWKLVSLSSVAAGMVAPYMWPAYVDALHRRDGSWIVHTFRKSMLLALGVTIPASLLLVWMGADIIEWWVGSEVRPSVALLWWMGAWSTILAAMSVVGSLINASGRVRRQATLGLVMAGVNVALSFAGARLFGSTGVIAATVISYFLIVMFPALLQLGGILKDIRTGAWWDEVLSR